MALVEQRLEVLRLLHVGVWGRLLPFDRVPVVVVEPPVVFSLVPHAAGKDAERSRVGLTVRCGVMLAPQRCRA